MWAIEYFCAACKPAHSGRFFKAPDPDDLRRYRRAAGLLGRARDLPIPNDAIPRGDETDRLHRWGYRRYRDLFNARQLLGLGLLLETILRQRDATCRDALLTVFSDFLRYQNLLCRYDTYALKCQDVFSVHGFPVGFVPCENNLLGIAGVGSGSFRHFIEKYKRAKTYCLHPFETRHDGSRKRVIRILGERIAAELTTAFPDGARRQAFLVSSPADAVELPSASLDGVFTDPPYFDNVQYAELMDFCFVWLRRALAPEHPPFRATTTRSRDELTGNVTVGRGLPEFASGLSAVFRRFAGALKPGAPFVFTYHHNDPRAYAPVVVVMLDAGLSCTAVLPAAAEMSASLHIAGTKSSILDSVFVGRVGRDAPDYDVRATLLSDAVAMRTAGVRLTAGDVRCLAAGHVARTAVTLLSKGWNPEDPIAKRLGVADRTLREQAGALDVGALVADVLRDSQSSKSPSHAADLFGERSAAAL